MSHSKASDQDKYRSLGARKSGYPRFDEKHNPDLLRCELCFHGPTCKRYRKGICGYAHAFKDLQPPNETTILYNKVWRNEYLDGMDKM